MTWLLGTFGTLGVLGVFAATGAFLGVFVRDAYRAIRWTRKGLCARCHAPLTSARTWNGGELTTCPNGHRQA